MATRTVSASSSSRSSHAIVLAELDARLRGCEREPLHEPRRLQDGVVRVEQGAGEAAGERLGQLGAPLGGEAVLTERLVLGPELVALVVSGEPEAARALHRIAAE